MRGAQVMVSHLGRAMLGAVTLALATVAAAGPSVLGRGLKPATFTQEFNAAAGQDQESRLVLTLCEERAAPSRVSASFGCTIADGFVSGIADHGALRDVRLVIPSKEQGSVHSFQRAGKYFVNATQGDRRSVPSAMGFVAGLMQDAMKAADRRKSAELGSVRYTVEHGPQASGEPAWTLIAESSSTSAAR